MSSVSEPLRADSLGQTQLLANCVKFELKEDPFIIPIKFKRDLPINRNIFELQEPQPKNYKKRDADADTSQMSMLDPIKMNIATIKFLLFQKLITYISIFSLILSIYQVYFVQKEEQISPFLTLFQATITGMLILALLFSAYFQLQNNKSRKIEARNLPLKVFLKIALIVMSPNPWWGQDQLLYHLTMMGRLFFPATYYIRSAMYYSPRAARIIYLYGIKPQLTFEFAWKVLFNNLGIFDVLTLYVGVVLVFTHCLFLAQGNMPFIQCFEIVIVTLPTIGFGDILVQGIAPQVIILLILLTGVALNAYVTLIILKKFQMTSNESNSNMLFQKLNIVQEIEQISSDFIIRKFQKQREESGEDTKFKQAYKDLRTRYRKLNLHDSNHQFSFFKQSLMTLRIKIHQVNNMITVLLAQLINHKQQQNVYTKYYKPTS